MYKAHLWLLYPREQNHLTKQTAVLNAEFVTVKINKKYCVKCLFYYIK